MSASEEIKVRLVKSGIGYRSDQKVTLRCLGLTRLNKVVTHKDTPSVRGMINKVRHLVEVEGE